MSAPSRPGPLALVGSGEFLPAMAEVDAALLDGRTPRVAVIPTAAGPEGDVSVGRWFGLAHEHYAGLGAEVVEVDVRTREQALDPTWADRVADVGLVYLSGGNPSHLADTLRDTPLGEAVVAAWRGGAALAGCSAGAMALGPRTLSPRGGSVTGLGVATDVVTIPHFDRFGFARRFAAMAASLVTDDGHTVVGIDEETACTWLPAEGRWVVMGARKAWLLTGTGDRGDGHGHGAEIPLPAPA